MSCSRFGSLVGGDDDGMLLEGELVLLSARFVTKTISNSGLEMV